MEEAPETAILLAAEAVYRARSAHIPEQARATAIGVLYRALGHRGWQAAVLDKEPGVLPWLGWPSGDSRALVFREDGAAQIWDMASGEMVCVLGGRLDGITRVAWEETGCRLSAQDRQGTIRWWDAATGTLLADSEVSAMPSQALGAGSDASYLITTLDGGNHAYFLSPEDLIAFACTRVQRNLTRAAWENHVGGTVSYRKTCASLP